MPLLAAVEAGDTHGNRGVVPRKGLIERKVFAGFLAVLLAATAASLIAYRSRTVSLAVADEVIHTQRILHQLDRILSHVQDLETGGRGYVIAGDERFLEPYWRALERVDAEMEVLKRLATERGGPDLGSGAVESAVRAKIAHVRQSVALRREGEGQASLQRVATGKGKQLMDTVRARIGEIERREAQHLEEILPHLRAPRAVATWAFTGVVLLMAGLLAGVYYLLVRDLRVRYRAAEALRAAAREARRALDLLDHTRDGIFIFDADTLRFSHVNRGAIEQTGYTGEELLGMTPLDIKPEFDQATFRAMLAPVIDGRSASRTFATVHRRKDGTEVPVEVVVQHTPRPDDVRLVVAVVRDIAERQRMQLALAESEEHLRLAVGAARIGTWHWDLANDRLVWSDRCKAIFGLPPNEAMSYERFLAALHPDDRQRTDAAVQDALRNRTGYDVEYRAVWPDGSPRWVAAKGQGYYDGAGSPVRMEGVVLDITGRKRAEERQRRLQTALEGANRELEAFSYTVSHDLRAPLRSIEGFSQLLAETNAERLDEDGHDYLRRILAAVRRMGELINDLLQLSRVTRSPLQPVRTDLSKLARAVVETLREREPTRQVEVVIEDGMSARGDTGLLRVVLDNLLGNAWKFTGRRDDARIEFRSLRRNGHAVYIVRDNGAGFDMAYAGKLFGAFQRLHMTSEFEGTGIGLATVQRIVHRHGGEIWAEGTLGEGATFSFTIGEPLLGEADFAVESRPQAAAPGTHIADAGGEGRQTESRS
ncbi:PAS domain S-box protein [Candidatus Binatia bacterium]|nr:PAS domain S-box protein [Candidatus Binatia bacterium]